MVEARSCPICGHDVETTRQHRIFSPQHNMFSPCFYLSGRMKIRCPACYCNMDVVIDKDGFGTEQEAEKAYDKFCELVTKRWNRRVIDEQNG